MLIPLILSHGVGGGGDVWHASFESARQLLEDSIEASGSVQIGRLGDALDLLALQAVPSA